jgi:hypothetical protein
MFPVDFQRSLARERLGLDVELVDGGHMAAMSRPAEVADRLEAFRLEVMGDGSRGSRHPEQRSGR